MIHSMERQARYNALCALHKKMGSIIGGKKKKPIDMDDMDDKKPKKPNLMALLLKKQ